MLETIDWRAEMDGWALAYPGERASAEIKLRPEDFRVTEQMDIAPAGEGEHFWLLITKRKQNTEQVARQLARHAGVAYRDVGYSGLKDFHAVSRQWFSVWLPGAKASPWDDFQMEGVQLDEVNRHSRKIKRGTHRANNFEIVAHNFSADPEELKQKLHLLDAGGVPNYFGSQRFGRDANNMQQAMRMLGGSAVKDRNLRSLLLSSARAWLFNTVVSQRIRQGSWDCLLEHEPANLDGTGSIFVSDGSPQQVQRLALLDIHPTAPMWGKYDPLTVQDYQQLFHWEQEQIAAYPLLQQGLIEYGLKYQRRPIRCAVNGLSWEIQGSQLMLEFELQRGQFATSVLRELFTI